MTSLLKTPWATFDPGPKVRLTSIQHTRRQWARVRSLVAALERERAAIESVRRGLFADSRLVAVPAVDHEALRRERRLSRRISNFKWMCIGGSIGWVAFLILV